MNNFGRVTAFDGSTSQYLAFGSAITALDDAGLGWYSEYRGDMRSIHIKLFEERHSGSSLLIDKFFGVYEIDWATQWIHQQINNFKSWR